MINKILDKLIGHQFKLQLIRQLPAFGAEYVCRYCGLSLRKYNEMRDQEQEQK